MELDSKMINNKLHLENLKSILAKDYVVKDKNQLSSRKATLLKDFKENP